MRILYGFIVAAIWVYAVAFVCAKAQYILNGDTLILTIAIIAAGAMAGAD